MSTIQQTNSAINSAVTTGASSKKTVENPQDRFLKLLVTQLKNQDPLKPMDNAEVTSQIAQISTVSGIDKLNTTLQALTDDVGESLSMEATGMIGHSVFVPGTAVELNGGAAKMGIELEQPVDQVQVTIKDSAGIAIRTMALEAFPAGVSTIPWDGKTDSSATAADGSYTFEVKATRGGEEVKVTQLALGAVKSVSPAEDGALLDMGKLGIVGLSDIKQVF